MRREPEVPEARVVVVERLDGPARIPSKELAPTHSVKSGILQHACSTNPSGCRLREKCSYAHRQVDERPTKRLRKKGDIRCSGYFENYTTIGLRMSGYGAA